MIQTKSVKQSNFRENNDKHSNSDSIIIKIDKLINKVGMRVIVAYQTEIEVQHNLERDHISPSVFQCLSRMLFNQCKLETTKFLNKTKTTSNKLIQERIHTLC